jgi:cytoskeleton protein RodZ
VNTTEQRAEAMRRESAAAAGPGLLLRSAREASGMSLDQVAQQLKLAPRQVKALEEEDFAQLPGRTFTRGFVRNYARLLNLDAGELMALLPDAAEAPALESPRLHSTGAMIAELPSAEARTPSFARWLIPLVLVGCVVAAAGYEWYRGTLAAPGASQRAPAMGTRPSASGDAARSATTGIPLPNPVAAQPAPTGGPAAPPAGESANTGASAEAAAQAAEAPSPAAVAPSATQPAAAPAPVLLSYRGPSWTEIRDRDGTLLISRLVPAGSEEPISGAPPFDIVIGNADQVTLIYRGRPVDLTRYTRQNVARLRLP